MIKGTQAEVVIVVLKKTLIRIRHKVMEVTLDIAANMNLLVKRCFAKADGIIDRFRVQKLAYEAVQEIRI